VRNAPTIVQLAKHLGVASSTVSRAFTNPGLLRPETVQRVLDAAAELGYVPNNFARALITGRSGV
jgi:LacI family transcriptional regulator